MQAALKFEITESLKNNMAKKKSVDLKHESIIYEQENRSYQVLRFLPASMQVDIKPLNVATGEERIAFAHLPKNVKQRIKPK